MRALVRIFLSWLLWLVPATSTQATSDFDDAEKLRDAILQAHGGAQRLKLFDASTRLSHGYDWRSDRPGKVASEVFRCKDFINARYADGDFTWSTVCNDRSAWYASGGIGYQLSRSELDQLHCTLRHDVIRILSQLDGSSVKKLAERDVEGRPCFGLLANLPGSSPVSLWVDKDTHLISQAEYICRSQVDGPRSRSQTSFVYQFTDYRDIVGVLYPSKTSRISSTRKYESVVEQLKIESPGINDERFRIAPTRLHPVVIPFSVRRGHLVVKCLINGQKIDGFIDTGASAIVFKNAVAKQCNVRFVNHELVALPKLNSVGIYSDATASKFTLGPSVFTNIPLTVQMNSKTPKEVLIGTDFLRQFCVTIDFKRRLIILSEPSDARVSKSDVAVPFVLDKRPYLEASVNQASKTWFLLDTGSPYTVLVSFDKSQQRKLNNGESQLVTTFAKSSASSIRIGDLVSINKPIVWSLVNPRDEDEVNIAGLPLLQGFSSVSFDFAGERLILHE